MSNLINRLKEQEYYDRPGKCLGELIKSRYPNLEYGAELGHRNNLTLILLIDDSLEIVKAKNPDNEVHMKYEISTETYPLSRIIKITEEFNPASFKDTDLSGRYRKSIIYLLDSDPIEFNMKNIRFYGDEEILDDVDELIIQLKSLI